MSDLEQVRADCARYGQQKNQLEDQINRDYQTYCLEVRRIYNSALELVDKNIKQLKSKWMLLIILSAAFCVIMFIVGIAAFSVISVMLGFFVLIIGGVLGLFNLNKLEGVKIERMENINLIKTEINKVFPGLIQL